MIHFKIYNKMRQHKAIMKLPVGGKAAWTKIMQGETPVDKGIDKNMPIVCSVAEFPDGTKVIGGVLKSDQPEVFNIKFMYATDANGKVYPNNPVDVSDNEDFMSNSITFFLNDNEEVEYQVEFTESTV